MSAAIIALALRASMFGAPEDYQPAPETAWLCRNQIEVWCAADGCAARPAGEFTPMTVEATVAASGAARISACAYSGCWAGEAAATALSGRILWAADGLAFSTAPQAAGTDVTLLIEAKDGVGFLSVGAIATPVLCTRSPMPRLRPGSQRDAAGR